MERRAGLGGRLVVAVSPGPVKVPALGGVRRPWGGRRGRLSAQQGDLISGVK